ncbi:hypothetical protein [Adonisia turfae]|uniref:Uncharacterized protein n=1 Tax=Adonisia turfae CCMR0081 TaxID=2292702 RepID=A0A6M0RHS4_9CYAN|nr:hypothetical protein [Adonisia turfae]NEZ55837.1 hypothetical protein [Adonisia turfae CCMR0081]
MSPPSFRSVNQNLGARPRLGPVPAELILPWGSIGVVTLLICQLLALSWVWTLVFILSGMAVWWILTGNTPWRFLAKFQVVPRWAKGYVLFVPFSLNSPQRSRKRRR